MAQVRNTATGQTLTIPDDQIPFMSSQWQVVKAGTTPAPTPTPAPTSTPTPTPTVAKTSTARTNPVMDAATTAKFQQAYGRAPNATDIANYNYNPAVVNQQLDSVIASKKTSGTTVNPAPTSTIPFKAGLSTEQQASITSLASKPAEQWNETDKKNWAYATNNSPAPTTQAGTGTGTGTGTAGTETAPSVDEQRTTLTGLGIDVSGLSDSQVGTLAAMYSIQQLNADKNKNIVPPNLTPQEMESYLRDAQSEIAPYYAEQLRIGGTEMMNTVADMSGDMEYKGRMQLQQNEEQMRQQGEQLAEAGLAFSGIRNKAESTLNEQQQGLIRSQASSYQQQLRDNALQFEKSFGSQALSNLNIPGMNYAGIALPPPLPLGGLMGTQGKAQTVDEKQRQQQLAQEALLKKGIVGGAITA